MENKGHKTSRFKIDFELLPVKAHYFLINGALAGVLPYLPVFAKHLGISDITVGIIYTIMPIVATIAKPLFGGLADHHHKQKLILLIFLTITTVSYLILTFIPNLKIEHYSPKGFEVTVKCLNTTNEAFQANPTDLSCIQPLVGNRSECTIICMKCDFESQLNNNSICQLYAANYTVYVEPFSKRNDVAINDNISWILQASNPTIYNDSNKVSCLELQSFDCKSKCQSDLNTCFQKIEKEQKDMFSSIHFWIFCVFIITAWVSTGVSVSLSDAICYEVLKDKMHLYGKQRLWGTIGWGLFATLSSYLNQIASINLSYDAYFPGFYLLVGLMIMDIIVVARISVTITTKSESIVRDIGLLFTRVRVITFILAVFFIGAFTGILWTYLFWFLSELKASQLLMGLSVAVQCFIGELPFFFFAGWIISKLGHELTMTVSLIAFGIRFTCYSFLYDPWLVLLIEVLQGPAFGAFYPAMTCYAKEIAPPGTESTVQGILGGVFEGLGMAVGSLLGGTGFNVYGGRTTFLIAGIVGFIVGTLNLVMYFLPFQRNIKPKSNTMKKSPEESTAFL